MKQKNTALSMLLGTVKYRVILLLAMILSAAIAIRMIDIAGVRYTQISWDELTHRISNLEEDRSIVNEVESLSRSPLYEKKIVYDGDSIAESRNNNGGGYAKLISDATDSVYVNFAKGGARLSSHNSGHSVVKNLAKLPDDADLYCFEGGINDFWGNVPIGTCDPNDYTGELDPSTICGALETIFRHCMDKFPGKPVCFVITHKIQNTAYGSNQNGDTFEDYRNAMVTVCQKYSIPYYDAFNESGLNGWNQTQNKLYLTANSSGKGDGIHPNEDGYRRYYAPQLLNLFERIIPME